ncbi:MAG: hypothetical protein ACRDS0_23225, partial [Pseudonocardiaceae bacterium]
MHLRGAGKALGALLGPALRRPRCHHRLRARRWSALRSAALELGDIAAFGTIDVAGDEPGLLVAR